MIIAIADLHLGSQISNKSGFIDFIHEFLEPNQDDISRLVFLGDILDLWRNSNSQVLSQNMDVLRELNCLDMKKNYLTGNHDYAILNLLGNNVVAESPNSTGVLDQVSETLELNVDGLQLKFTHGHQIDYWSALPFYEIFSQSLCFVDSKDEDLSDAWNIIYRFAESLPEKTRTQVRSLTKDIQSEIEQKLAGPLGNSNGKVKTGLLYEWELLRKVSILEDLAHRCSKPLDTIEQFALDWEDTITKLDQHREIANIPQQLKTEMHQMMRKAATLTIGLDDDAFLIRGHSHEPYVDLDVQVADAGCWLDSKGSYLKSEEGLVSVHEWK
ncbi:MAG: metallophosphoesterase [Candidatus Thorarchaeota archaeon]